MVRVFEQFLLAPIGFLDWARVPDEVALEVAGGGVVRDQNVQLLGLLLHLHWRFQAAGNDRARRLWLVSGTLDLEPQGRALGGKQSAVSGAKV